MVLLAAGCSLMIRILCHSLAFLIVHWQRQARQARHEGLRQTATDWHRLHAAPSHTPISLQQRCRAAHTAAAPLAPQRCASETCTSTASAPLCCPTHRSPLSRCPRHSLTASATPCTRVCNQRPTLGNNASAAPCWHCSMHLQAISERATERRLPRTSRATLPDTDNNAARRAAEREMHHHCPLRHARYQHSTAQLTLPTTAHSFTHSLAHHHRHTLHGHTHTITQTLPYRQHHWTEG